MPSLSPPSLPHLSNSLTNSGSDTPPGSDALHLRGCLRSLEDGAMEPGGNSQSGGISSGQDHLVLAPCVPSPQMPREKKQRCVTNQRNGDKYSPCWINIPRITHASFKVKQRSCATWQPPIWPERSCHMDGAHFTIVKYWREGFQHGASSDQNPLFQELSGKVVRLLCSGLTQACSGMPYHLPGINFLQLKHRGIILIMFLF